MEREFSTDARIDWQEIVSKAKEHRKARKLSQRRLAVVAGVSLPTVVNFEAGEDVRVSSALAIMKVLEMVAEPVLGGLLVQKTGETGAIEMRFLPYAGQGSDVPQLQLSSVAELTEQMQQLGLDAETCQRVTVQLREDGAADVPNLRLSATRLGVFYSK